METRDPIHLGVNDGRRPPGSAGEPILLLHPFLLSQNVWNTVADQLAETGRYEVFAPTMAGHHGGPRAGTAFLDIGKLVDGVERQMDELGWETAHLVGNSLGGWAAFELERRGRARSLTAIAPGGGWTRWSPAKFEAVARFLVLGPTLLAARLIGPRILDIPGGRRIGTLAISGSADAPTHSDLLAALDDATHCPAYFLLMVRTLLLPGLIEIADTAIPTQLVLCEKDRIFPNPRASRYFVDNLPRNTEVLQLEGMGHVPMLEAPGRITELIEDFVDAHTEPQRQAPPAG